LNLLSLLNINILYIGGSDVRQQETRFLAHIVFITNGMSSALNSGIAMSRLLRNAGHRVTFVAREDFGERVVAQGEVFVGLEQDRRMAELMAVNPMPSLARPLAMFRWLGYQRRLRRESIESDELTSIVRRLKPDVLVIDVEMHAAVIATSQLGIPTLLTMIFFSIFRRPGLPLLNAAMDPGTTPWRRFKIQCAWWRVRMGAIAQRVVRRLSRAGIGDYFRPVSCNTVQIAELRTLARHHGFNLRSETDRTQWLRPYTYRHLHVISYHPWEFELPHDPPPLVHYVGPMINADRVEPPLPLEALGRWEALKAARVSGQLSPRPLIYCSLSSFWAADARFLRRVLKVFAKRSDWDLVLGLGGKLTAADLAPVPDNALLLDWAPQLEILNHADSFVTHGGTTSISECAWFGVPMVVYSTKHGDHDGNSMRVMYHGLGVVADKDTDGEEQIERNIERTLSDPDIRRNVAAMRDRFHEYDQADRAMELVESYIGRGC